MLNNLIHLYLELADGVGATATLFLLADPLMDGTAQTAPPTGSELVIYSIQTTVASKTLVELHAIDAADADLGKVWDLTFPADGGLVPMSGNAPLRVGDGSRLALTMDTTAKTEIHVFARFETPSGIL